MRCCQDSFIVNSRLTDLVAATYRATIVKLMNLRIAISLLCLTGAALAQEQPPEFVLQNGHSDGVNAVAFSPDGKTIVSGSDDNTIKLWEAASGKLLRTLESHVASVFEVTFSSDSKLLASGSSDSTIKLWDVASGKLIRILEGHSGPVLAVAFSPDGKALASGSWDGSIKLWDIVAGNLIHTLKGHSSLVISVVFSPDGKTLASGSSDKTIKLWNMASGKLRRTIEGNSSTMDLAFSPDGKSLASGDWDGTIKLWEVHSGQLVRTLEGHSSLVNSVVFSSDGKTLASGSSDKTIKLWNMASGKLLRTLEEHSEVRDLAFSPDSKTIVSGSEDNTIKLWETNTGNLLRAIKGHSSPTTSIVFSPDGRTLAHVGGNNIIKLWEMASGKLLHTLEGHSSPVWGVAISPDGMTLASGSRDNTVKLWEVVSGKLLSTLEGHSSAVYEVTFSPDGKFLASGSLDSTVKLWDIPSGKLLCTIEDHSAVWNLAFSPDGKTLVSGGKGNTIRLWDMASGKLLRTLSSLSAVRDLAFSPDGKTLASGDGDNKVMLWEIASGKLLRTLEGHSSLVTTVAFSLDGNTIASGSGDNTVKLWEMASGKLCQTFKGHSSSVTAVTFSPDSKTLVSGSLDASLRFWKANDGTLLSIAYVIDKNDYIIYSPQGYFASSKNAERFAAWRIGNEVYTFDQYGEQLNRPDLIARILAGEEVPAPPIRLAVDLPPHLVWANPISSTSTQQVEIVLQYKGTSGLGDLVLIHNGEPIEIKPPTGKQETEIRIPLQLTTYDNSLRILAYDEKRLKSDWQRIDFQYESGQKGGRNVRETVERKPQLGDYGKKYAIVIGISDYKHLQKTAANENDLVDLQFAHKDAQDFVAFLQDSTRSGGGWEIHRFINAEATTPKIDETLTRILTLANSRDLIFIFFSGHARSHPLRPGDVYLLTHEFEPAVLRSGYDYSLLIKLIAETKAEHVIAFIDACRSGTIGFGKGEKQPVVDAEAFGKRLEQIRENQVIFSSASGAQLSHEDPNLKQSVFTHFLLKGLRGAAAEEKFPEFIDLGELYKYVRENVSTHVQRQLKAAQLPILWEKSGAPDENFPVAIRPNASAINKTQ